MKICYTVKFVIAIPILSIIVPRSVQICYGPSRADREGRVKSVVKRQLCIFTICRYDKRAFMRPSITNINSNSITVYIFSKSTPRIGTVASCRYRNKCCTASINKIIRIGIPP